ncbi:MAG: nucleotidyltransferase domain-containing protein [Candidatus Acidiferrales bacterium]
MKKFYEAYVNGQGIRTSRYLAFPFGSGIAPENYLKTTAPNESSTELVFERSSNAGLLNQELTTVYSLLLHGSQASNEVMPFSDIDVVAILDDSLLHTPLAIKKDVLALRRFCRWMFSQDPLMHHGLMFIALSEFSHYDESFLPIQTLVEAKSICGNCRIRIIKGNSADVNAAGKLRRSLYWLCQYDFNLHHFQQDYSLKEFISGILLLPAQYLASAGRFMTKRDSFKIAYTEFPKIDWSVIQRAEEIRAKWTAPELHPLHSTAIGLLSGKAQSLGRFFYNRNFRKMSDSVQLLQRGVPAIREALERAP